MNYQLNVKAFLKAMPIAKLSGHQKFLALSALRAGGKVGASVSTRDVSARWKKSILGIEYNSAFYDRAQGEGWVDPTDGRRGAFSITQSGLEHLEALGGMGGRASTTELRQAGGLFLVNRRAAHSFDKFLRMVFAEAKSEVLIADSWVDGTIYGTVLDVLPRSLSVRLVFAQARGNFDARSTRFSTEYQKFAVRRYKALHDRFVIVDGKGYILGPSIKDAATNSPALVVRLDGQESRLLTNFFGELWAKGKAVIR
jgi:hypothetical protein